MQLQIVVICGALLVSESAVTGHSLLRRVNATGSRTAVHVVKKSDVYFGHEKCPCIGFDNIEGETMVVIEKGKEKASYPADLGASCDAWEENNHPKCTQGGDRPDWCTKEWCYVDPKNCHLPTLPKKSDYQPKAKYQGLPLYYSYHTCGSTDTWNDQVPEYGSPGCRCVGIDNTPGTTKVVISGKKHDYPAEVGGECKAWDNGNHPECDGDGDKPDYCKQKWCYVDPCACKMPVPPKISSYMPEATFQGRQIFYSYSTCGGEDSWTSANHKAACVNQKSAEACKLLDECAWTDKEECLGKDLVEECGSYSGACGLKPLFILPLLVAFLK